MPPEQGQRLLDLLGDGLHFGAHFPFDSGQVDGATYSVAFTFVSSGYQ
jgi:hypothetical protein